MDVGNKNVFFFSFSYHKIQSKFHPHKIVQVSKEVLCMAVTAAFFIVHMAIKERATRVLLTRFVFSDPESKQ